jgi:aryl carrier-like protein
MEGYKLVITWLNEDNAKLCDSVMVYRESIEQITDDTTELIREQDELIMEGLDED